VFCFGSSLRCTTIRTQFDRRYFVYMVQSSSRRALYIGFTNFLIMRVIEHRTSKYPSSFTAKYVHGVWCTTKSTEMRKLPMTASGN
jgi:predicted GIY-YIG superfamily endonuclease